MTVDPHDLTLLKGPRKGVLFERRPGVTLPAVAHHVSGHYRLPRNSPGDGRFASTARAPDLPSESTCDAIPCRKVPRGLAGACTRFRLAGVHWPVPVDQESDNAAVTATTHARRRSSPADRRIGRCTLPLVHARYGWHIAGPTAA